MLRNHKTGVLHTLRRYSVTDVNKFNIHAAINVDFYQVKGENEY